MRAPVPRPLPHTCSTVPHSRCATTTGSARAPAAVGERGAASSICCCLPGRTHAPRTCCRPAVSARSAARRAPLRTPAASTTANGVVARASASVRVRARARARAARRQVPEAGGQTGTTGEQQGEQDRDSKDTREAGSGRGGAANLDRGSLPHPPPHRPARAWPATASCVRARARVMEGQGVRGSEEGGREGRRRWCHGTHDPAPPTQRQEAPLVNSPHARARNATHAPRPHPSSGCLHAPAVAVPRRHVPRVDCCARAW